MWSTASTEDATISFAKAARRSKASPESPFQVSDLTAALSQIQGHATDDLVFEFKVPADPSLFAADARISAADVEAFKMLVESIDLLLEWKWSESISLGKKILAKTDIESIRDEALNVIAAGLALSGDIEGGTAALKKAAEGEWNFALQQNLGILALKIDPELAANQSTYWLDAAETTEDRESAIFFVLKMWSSLEDSPKPVATQAFVPNPEKTTVTSFTSMWPAIMDALLKYSRVAWMGFTESTPLSFENGLLTVGVKDSGRYNNVEAGGHKERLRQAIVDVLEIDTKIVVVSGTKGVDGGGTEPPVAQDEDKFHLPIRIRDSFRAAINQDLSLNTFSMLGMFLARNDSEWLENSKNWDSSPNSDTEVAQMILARATGLDEFIDFLVENAGSTGPEIAQARTNFISQLVDAMLEGEAAMWAASLAISLVGQGLPCDSMNNAMLRALAVREICLYLRENDGEPKDAFLDWLIDVREFNESLTDLDLRDYLDLVLKSAATSFIVGYLIARNHELAKFEEQLNTIYAWSRNWNTKRRLNRPHARELSNQVLHWAKDVANTLDKMRLLTVVDGNVIGFINELTESRIRAQQMATESLRKL
jgi:hypothetical protein